MRRKWAPLISVNGCLPESLSDFGWAICFPDTLNPSHLSTMQLLLLSMPGLQLMEGSSSTDFIHCLIDQCFYTSECHSSKLITVKHVVRTLNELFLYISVLYYFIVFSLSISAIITSDNKERRPWLERWLCRRWGSSHRSKIPFIVPCVLCFLHPLWVLPSPCCLQAQASCRVSPAQACQEPAQLCQSISRMHFINLLLKLLLYF